MRQPQISAKPKLHSTGEPSQCHRITTFQNYN